MFLPMVLILDVENYSELLFFLQNANTWIILFKPRVTAEVPLLAYGKDEVSGFSLLSLD